MKEEETIYPSFMRHVTRYSTILYGGVDYLVDAPTESTVLVTGYPDGSISVSHDGRPVTHTAGGPVMVTPGFSAEAQKRYRDMFGRPVSDKTVKQVTQNCLEEETTVGSDSSVNRKVTRYGTILHKGTEYLVDALTGTIVTVTDKPDGSISVTQQDRVVTHAVGSPILFSPGSGLIKEASDDLSSVLPSYKTRIQNHRSKPSKKQNLPAGILVWVITKIPTFLRNRARALLEHP